MAGKHDLWVLCDRPERTTLEKFKEVCAGRAIGRLDRAFRRARRRDHAAARLVLLFVRHARRKFSDAWMDSSAFRWPAHFHVPDDAAHFEALSRPGAPEPAMVISSSHFLQRIELMLGQIPPPKRTRYPLLGSVARDDQVPALRSRSHMCGHSQVNRHDGIYGASDVDYALGFHRERRIT